MALPVKLMTQEKVYFLDSGACGIITMVSALVTITIKEDGELLSVILPAPDSPVTNRDFSFHQFLSVCEDVVSFSTPLFVLRNG